MKNNIAKATNAVLMDSYENQVIAIISCDIGENVTPKLKQAICDHFVTTDVLIWTNGKELTEIDSMRFSCNVDGSNNDFELITAQTY